LKFFWNWLVKNVSNIFSFLGIILTLYFGTIYVPNWIEKNKNEKLINAQMNLEQSIKELVYSESPTELVEIEGLVRAKEIQIRQAYPISRQELLTKVQESFMQDRFLPLETRKLLMAELELLKDKIQKRTLINVVLMSESNNSAYLSQALGWFSIVVTIVGVIAGVVTSFFRHRMEKAKQEEIDNQLIDIEQEDWSHETASDFEESIIDIIASFDGVTVKSKEAEVGYGADLEFIYNKKYYFVEIKYLLKSKVGLRSFEKFVNESKGNEGNFWFIYNTDLTAMVKSKATELRRINTENRKIKLIKASSQHLFESQLGGLLNG
jgi:hypothetical protein